jgi:hypothetical protein
MKLKRTVANIAGVVGLFFTFIIPVGRMVFSDTVGSIAIRAKSGLGIYRHAEPGDFLVDMSLMLSLLLAISIVWLANLIIDRRNGKDPYVK